MKLYKTQQGIVIEKVNSYYVIKDRSWDTFINDDPLYEKMEEITLNASADPRGKSLVADVQVPLESQ